MLAPLSGVRFELRHHRGDDWLALVLIDADASHSLGDSLGLALDQHERLRFAYAAGCSVLFGYGDGDCVGRSGAEDWSLTQVESANDSVADDVFLYESCNEGAWLLRQPTLAITVDGLPSVTYRSEDMSSS